jgi:hypothetical protein
MDAALTRLVWHRANGRCEYCQMPQAFDDATVARGSEGTGATIPEAERQIDPIPAPNPNPGGSLTPVPPGYAGVSNLEGGASVPIELLEPCR